MLWKKNWCWNCQFQIFQKNPQPISTCSTLSGYSGSFPPCHTLSPLMKISSGPLVKSEAHFLHNTHCVTLQRKTITFHLTCFFELLHSSIFIKRQTINMEFNLWTWRLTIDIFYQDELPPASHCRCASEEQSPARHTTRRAAHHEGAAHKHSRMRHPPHNTLPWNLPPCQQSPQTFFFTSQPCTRACPPHMPLPPLSLGPIFPLPQQARPVEAGAL